MSEKKILKCTCGYEFEEPPKTIGKECPNCGSYLIIPSFSDWFEMYKNSILNQKPKPYNYSITPKDEIERFEKKYGI